MIIERADDHLHPNNFLVRVDLDFRSHLFQNLCQTDAESETSISAALALVGSIPTLTLITPPAPVYPIGWVTTSIPFASPAKINPNGKVLLNGVKTARKTKSDIIDNLFEGVYVFITRRSRLRVFIWIN